MRWRAIAIALSLAPGMARADDVGNRLSSYEAEVRQIGNELQQPANAPLPGRTLTDAIVAFDLGDYENAAAMLLDLQSSTTGFDKETAIFYLGETLYNKGDRGGARTYFAALTDGKSVGSKYYQPSLIRQVEIAIAQHESADQPLALLDQISPTQRLPNVSYVKAKFAFSENKYDESLARLAEVPKGSAFELQTQYYTGTIYVAKQDYPRATEIFIDLIGRNPKSAADRRVIELGQLALARLYYQQDQFSRAIDSYLLIDRHSDMFPDALYEVSWVYVKNKQYDKALRALELLATSRPQASETPTVRLLEGNLHIRKAQRLRETLINGTIDNNEKIDPAEEYGKAAKLFEKTKADFAPAYDTITHLIEDKVEVGQFIAQIAHRTDAVETTVPIPEAAAELLREEPDVKRVVDVEKDLGEIKARLDRTASNIARMQALLATNDTSTLYPQLEAKRARVIQLQELLIGIRNDLAEQQEKLVTPSGDLPQLADRRRNLAQQYKALGDPEKAYIERRRQERNEYTKLEKLAGEARGAIDSAQAMAIAIRKYATSPDAKLPPETGKAATTQLDTEAHEAKSIETDLVDVHEQIELGRDLAGVGDAQIAAARALRKELMIAQDNELNALAAFASGSHDPNRSQNLAGVATRATRSIDQLRAVEAAIDKRVADSVVSVRQQLVTEQALLAGYQNELGELEAEAHDLGAIVLVAALANVKARLDDIVVRADVGTIDTSWAQKSDTDDDLKRLNLTRAREIKQLKDEFRDILEANTPKPSKKPVSDMPVPVTNGTTLSPDKGGNTRIAPIGSSPGGTSTVKPDTVKPDAVKPDDKKPDPKKPDPKKGGSK